MWSLLPDPAALARRQRKRAELAAKMRMQALEDGKAAALRSAAEASERALAAEAQVCGGKGGGWGMGLAYLYV